MPASPPARKLRIVQYFSGLRLEGGGPIRLVIDLCNVLAARGHEIVLVTYNAPDIPADWNKPGKPRTILIPGPVHPNWFLGHSAAGIFKTTLAAGDVGHVHCPWISSNIQFANAAHNNGVPFVLTSHGSLNDWAMSQRGPKKRFFLSLVGRRLLQGADSVHFTAQSELDQSWKWIGRGRPAVIPCVVDLEPYRRLPGPQLARNTFAPARPDGPVVLFLSRLHEVKGLDLLIDAFAIVRNSGSAARLLIAGSGDPVYESALRKQVHDRHLDDRVFFLGMVKGDVKLSLYQRADLLVHPTRQDSFGLVLVEALACGTPVVTTRGTDIWREMEQAGCTIAQLDPASLAKAILDSLADPEKLRRRSVQGREWVFANLDSDRLAVEYERLYQRMIERRHRPAPVAAPRPVVRFVKPALPLYHTPRPPVSVVILTRNEAANIRDCIASAAWCDDIHVLDSCSSDGTPQIAAAAGAHVHTNPFSTIDAQHNWAIDNIRTKYPWQFHIDADERFTKELVAEMVRRLGPGGSDLDAAGFRVPGQMIFQHRWVRHGSGYPAYQVRLIHNQRCRFILVGHGQREKTNGRIGTLLQPYAHFSFSKGMGHWFKRHNIYSDFEAREAIADLSHPLTPRNLFSPDPVVRRRELKRIAYRLHGRGIWRFLFNYVYLGGWLDGSPGFHYSLINLVYEFWTELKIVEGRFTRRIDNNPLARYFAGPTVAQHIKLEILHADVAAQRRVERKRLFRDAVRGQPVLGRLRRWRRFLRDDLGPELPFRPLFRFVAAMFSRSRLEQGVHGLHSAFFSACSEYMTCLFYREQIGQRRVLFPPENRTKDVPQPAHAHAGA